MVVADPVSQGLVRLLARIAPSDVPVMISGETGTGKEVVARHIHRASGRKGPFLAVNCSAIAERLATSEMFAAAAAGGNGRREDWFDAADHGTLFLDEIADLPPNLQGQLLRVLQEHEVLRGGSPESAPMDVRLITATNVDLAEAASAGHFRLDLFYRLNIAQVKLLPLRQRRGDIEALANHFLRTYGKRLNLALPTMTSAALTALLQYPWPGNIRELENVIRFGLLVAPEQELRVEHLQLNSTPLVVQRAFAPSPEDTEESPQQRLSRLLTLLFQAPGESLFTDLENRIIAEAFRFARQNQVRAAALLGISRNVLRTLLKKHGLLER